MPFRSTLCAHPPGISLASGRRFMNSVLQVFGTLLRSVLCRHWLMASRGVSKQFYGVAFSSSPQFIAFIQYASGSQGSHFLSGPKLLTSRVTMSGPNTERSGRAEGEARSGQTPSSSPPPPPAKNPLGERSPRKRRVEGRRLSSWSFSEFPLPFPTPGSSWSALFCPVMLTSGIWIC